MILLVADEDAAAAVAAALSDAEVDAVATASEARRMLSEVTPAVLVLDFPSVAGAADLFAALRAGEFGDPAVPSVLLVEDDLPDLPTLAFDEVVYHPFRESALAEAVDRAREVSRYRAAIERLYESSRERATEGAPFDVPADLRAARDEADDRLADILDRPGVVSALLWTADESRTED